MTGPIPSPNRWIELEAVVSDPPGPADPTIAQ